jgi:DNA-binding SARP family transcriptional activator
MKTSTDCGWGARGCWVAVPSRGDWLLPEDDRTVVYVLGRFAVVRDGVELSIPLGLPQKLVKFVATRDRGRTHVEQAIEALWPGGSAADGRRRLRNVLNRVRESCGDLIVRQGETLSFLEGAEVDAQLFEQEARRALGAGDDDDEAVSMARAVEARYEELLPDDLYEPWVAVPRERLKQQCLRLIDLIAADARERGNDKAERAALERALEVDPEDVSRLLDAAESLHAQGKKLQAYALLVRAKRAARAAGLPEPPDFDDL